MSFLSIFIVLPLNVFINCDKAPWGFTAPYLYKYCSLVFFLICKQAKQISSCAVEPLLLQKCFVIYSIFVIITMQMLFSPFWRIRL